VFLLKHEHEQERVNVLLLVVVLTLNDWSGHAKKDECGQEGGEGRGGQVASLSSLQQQWWNEAAPSRVGEDEGGSEGGGADGRGRGGRRLEHR